MKEERSYFVYTLRCSDGSYYTGVTSNPEARVYAHQRGLIPGYTKNRRPVELVFAEETNDIGGAIYREKQIKRWSRKKKEALIRGDEQLLKLRATGKGYWHRRWHGGRGKRRDLSW